MNEMGIDFRKKPENFEILLDVKRTENRMRVTACFNLLNILIGVLFICSNHGDIETNMFYGSLLLIIVLNAIDFIVSSMRLYLEQIQ